MMRLQLNWVWRCVKGGIACIKGIQHLNWLLQIFLKNKGKMPEGMEQTLFLDIYVQNITIVILQLSRYIRSATYPVFLAEIIGWNLPPESSRWNIA